MLSANITDPVVIRTPSDVLRLFQRNTTSVNLAASVDMRIPVFLVYNGFGFGATIEYE